MISVQEFLIRARLDQRSLEAWIAAGWLISPEADGERAFSDVDLSRAQLIRDLRDDLGVNDEGISVILNLIDQVHGLRRSMEALLNELRENRECGDRSFDTVAAIGYIHTSIVCYSELV